MAIAHLRDQYGVTRHDGVASGANRQCRESDTSDLNSPMGTQEPEALPWLVLHYWPLDREWLVREAKRRKRS
jgi:hypothetical protein